MVEPFSPSDIQDHSTPHMKTRVAVRDRTPHRFQVVPLQDAKLRQPAASLSNARQGLKDVTNLKPSSVRRELKPLVRPPGKLDQLKPVSVTKPLNIIKHSPRRTGLRLPVNRSRVSAPIAALPAFDFLTSPAEFTPTLPKRSRSSYSVFASKLPTSSSRTRSDCTISNPTTPTPSYQSIASSMTTTSTITTPATTKLFTHIDDTNKSLRHASMLNPSPQNPFTSRIPASKLKATFNSRTLDPALPKPHHCVAHSIDVHSNLLQAPRQRQLPDVRRVFPRTSEIELAKVDIAPSPAEALPRLRRTPNSQLPSKRHAIYTRSLYVGRDDKSSDTYLRALQGTASLQQTSNQALDDVPAANDSLDSIVQVYRDQVHDTGRSCLPTSLSEPTLHDISLVCPDVTVRVTAASVSLSSVSSVYSQDSWASGKHENVTSSEQQAVVDSAYHPIVWDLLQKLESAEKAWIWDM